MTEIPNTHGANKRHLTAVPDLHTDGTPDSDDARALYVQGGLDFDECSAAATELEVSRVNLDVARVRHHDATYAQTRATSYLEQAEHAVAIAARRAAAAGQTPAAIANQLRVDEEQVRQWISSTQLTPPLSWTAPASSTCQ
ncbi:hypothetical protein [Mycobacteroides chelonae]|uniref:hypothetical protein n=1 Tax=Mycobacteroides chelonae TaxID=1774 RepID=UPI0008A82D57|nr:hypothetical protein [Mycobacteroides chelonae]OHU13152.1 hypothetical protein BKG75_17030 [Mycobacteroides chelonae]